MIERIKDFFTENPKFLETVEGINVLYSGLSRWTFASSEMLCGRIPHRYQYVDD